MNDALEFRLAEQLNGLEFDAVEIMATGGHPVVYGEWLKAGAKAPTILFMVITMSNLPIR